MLIPNGYRVHWQLMSREETVLVTDGIEFMRVLLASIRLQMAHALRFFLDQQPHVHLVGEVAHTADLLRKAADTKPDIVLLDWELPGQPDALLLDGLRAGAEQRKVIVLGGTARAARTAHYDGADAYVSHGDPPERLLRHLPVLGDTDRGGADIRDVEIGNKLAVPVEQPPVQERKQP